MLCPYLRWVVCDLVWGVGMCAGCGVGCVWVVGGWGVGGWGGGGGEILCNMLEALCRETGRSTKLPHLCFHSLGRALMTTLHTLCFLLLCHLSLHFVLCGDCANMISWHVTQWRGYSPFTAWIHL